MNLYKLKVQCMSTYVSKPFVQFFWFLDVSSITNFCDNSICLEPKTVLNKNLYGPKTLLNQNMADRTRKEM